MTVFIAVESVGKSFAIAEQGTGPVSLMDALRAGKRDSVHREIVALQDVSFSAVTGDRVGIIGRNGAGKTTLLAILAGIAEPTSGRVQVNGDLHAMLSIGAVLREESTGRENIYLDGAVHGRSREDMDRVAPEIIAFSELGEFIDRPVRTYSSGMKARLAFSMGAFIKTDILVIDETLSVGDAKFSRNATRQMKKMTDDGKIVIVVSHSLGDIVQICTRCLWLENGKVRMDGDPETVTKAYRNAIEETDEADLRRKFSLHDHVVKRALAGAIHRVELIQSGNVRASSVTAFDPLTIRVCAHTGQADTNPDVYMELKRVDGRIIWRSQASSAGICLPQSGDFSATLTMDPFVLGASLFRLEVSLVDDAGLIASSSRVFEVIDEIGQSGGSPMLFYPVQFSTTRSEAK
jgi:lipopolysaccharide transport system ATP-binding protein